MRIRIGTGLVGLVALGGAVGCNSFDEPVTEADTEPKLVIPIDERPVRSSPVTPLPVSGGTLAIAGQGRYAVAADPERDRVSVVDLTTLQLTHTVDLGQGAEPGRVVEGRDGLVHVALRGSGEVATIDTLTGTVRERAAVCKAPRGIAIDQATGLLHVACLEGKLVSLDSGLDVVRSVNLETDLRDVVVRGTELWVTRFKSAEVLRVAATGAVVSRVVLPNATRLLTQPSVTEEEKMFGPTVPKEVAVQPGVAWRAVPTNAGGAVIVHQQAVIDDIEITEPSPQGGSAYGGGGGFTGDCSGGIVKNVVTTIQSDGTPVSSPFEAPPMAVDIALSPNQQFMAIAHASPPDFEAPRPFTVFRDEFGGDFQEPSFVFASQFTSSVSVMSLGSVGSTCMFNEGAFFDAPVTAVAFAARDPLVDPVGDLIVQMREPAQLAIVTEVPSGAPLIISLGGETRADTGHEIFHRDSGGGIACGSCHPEAGEDGHVWSFAGTGLRRTQSLHVGLRDTAPFHWNGDLQDLGALMSEVFVGRMGGVKQTPERLTSLSEWIFSLSPPPAIRDLGDEAVARGQELFGSRDVGCTNCHTGTKLTNNTSVAVFAAEGSSELQVPSLLGVGYRAPFMHDGCAPTLQARFDPACGGDAHGDTASLTPEQIADLVAFLESL